eukprot:jgi/Mesvir1/15169/Mv04849-RA.1
MNQLIDTAELSIPKPLIYSNSNCCCNQLGGSVSLPSEGLGARGVMKVDIRSLLWYRFLVLILCIIGDAQGARPSNHLFLEGGQAKPIKEGYRLPPNFNQIRPFVVLHGISDECAHAGMQHFVAMLRTKLGGAPGKCIEILGGASDSWFRPMTDQVVDLCTKVKADPDLADGFNLVGLSQGGLLARAYLHMCPEGPRVYSLVSLGGPQAGEASLPKCMNPWVCRELDRLIAAGVYSPIVQAHVGPAGYFKDPLRIPAYLRGCTFLPFLNRELPTNATRKEIVKPLASLARLVLVQFARDTVLDPPSTSWFGFYADGDRSAIVPFNQTSLYTEDRIGLRQLDQEGKLILAAAPGDHLDINEETVDDYIIPALML